MFWQPETAIKIRAGETSTSRHVKFKIEILNDSDILYIKRAITTNGILSRYTITKHSFQVRSADTKTGIS